MSEPIIEWRGPFTSVEANELHADAFDHRVFGSEEWDWLGLCERHSLGWVTAREGDRLVGFANVISDGAAHAWLQDVMVATDCRNRGIGLELIETASHGATRAECEWLHVDFDDELKDFYFGAAGFTPTNAGLMDLTRQSEDGE